MEKQYCFICEGEPVGDRILAGEGHIDVPRVGELVQLREKGTYKTYVVEQVMYKFPNGIQRILILIAEVSPEDMEIV